MTVKIALATCVTLPEPDHDQDLLIRRLEEKGVEARLLPWDGPNPLPAPDEIVVVRSTWNYYTNIDAFRAWLDRLTPGRVFNPIDIIKGNVDKRYLQDLEARVAIVPTAWDARDVAATMHERGWETVVIKPVVSAGSFSTRRFTRAEVAEAQAFLDAAGREMMIQRWMPAVETSGERSLVWIAGELVHAVRKSPRLANASEHVSQAIAIADDERTFAERVLAPIADRILYARVDIIRDENELRLMELELVEPALFLKQHPPALERFADAVARAREIPQTE